MKSKFISRVLVTLLALTFITPFFIPLYERASAQNDAIGEIAFTAYGSAINYPQFRSTTARAALVYGSQDEYDMYDMPHPPPAPVQPYLESAFIAGTEKYLRDARPPRAENVFNLRVTLYYDSRASMTLAWDLSSLPEIFVPQLTDRQSNKVINLRELPNYSFEINPATGPPMRDFILTISAAGPLPTPEPTATPALVPTPERAPTPASVPTPAAVVTPAPSAPGFATPAQLATPAPTPVPAGGTNAGSIILTIILIVAVIIVIIWLVRRGK